MEKIMLFIDLLRRFKFNSTLSLCLTKVDSLHKVRTSRKGKFIYPHLLLKNLSYFGTMFK